MSRPTRLNAEGRSSRPSETAWGCLPSKGWVPFPSKLPRRHPLLDSVGRTDEPCDRPAHKPPDWSPQPAFQSPREGYPNDMCNLEDFKDQRTAYDSQIPEGAAVINVGQNTPTNIRVKIPAMVNSLNCDDGPTVDECCKDTRNLDILKEKYQEIVGPLEEIEAGQDVQFTKCMTSCQPLLPRYPCRGVIDEMTTPYVQLSPEELCKPISLHSGENTGSIQDLQNITGWEFIDKCRTCDYYPIQVNLPGRFNNPMWFKGYGCERPFHPFYVTTGADYGRFGPNPHTMTQAYYPLSGEFTEILRTTGMYRNRTLNTSNNKTIV